MRIRRSKHFQLLVQWRMVSAVVSARLHGGEFNDNQYRHLLTHTDTLRDISSNPQVGFMLTCLIHWIKSEWHVSVNHSVKISMKRYGILSPSICHSPFLQHFVTVHVLQLCKYQNAGLGHFSEQASESVHSDFAWHNVGTVWNSEHH